MDKPEGLLESLYLLAEKTESGPGKTPTVNGALLMYKDMGESIRIRDVMNAQSKDCVFAAYRFNVALIGEVLL